MPGRLAAVSKTVDAVMTTGFTTNSTRMGPFLGACNVYKRFSIDFSKIFWEISGYIRNDKKLDFWDAITEDLEAFNV